MSPDTAYAALEERVLARDQKGASEVYYELVKSGRPLPEMLREAVRIHAPYTHVPYHERIDDGYVNFVNNDHCLLSARATLHLSKMVPAAAAGLPMAQTIWYIPTGLDIWNQKIVKAPGHYARGIADAGRRRRPRRSCTGPTRSRERLDGSLKERLDHWMTLVHRGQVLDAYRVFLGLMAEPAERARGAGGAGLRRPDRRAGPRLPEPLLHHRPQVLPRPRHGRARRRDRLGRWRTTCSMPARSTSPSARAGTRPTRWPATPSRIYLERQKILHAMPYGGTTEHERRSSPTTEPLTQPESEALPRGRPAPARAGLSRALVTAAAQAGKDPRRSSTRCRSAAAAGRARDAGRPQLLPAAALLRVLQHARLVLRQFRASAADQAALSRGVLSSTATPGIRS